MGRLQSANGLFSLDSAREIISSSLNDAKSMVNTLQVAVFFAKWVQGEYPNYLLVIVVADGLTSTKVAPGLITVQAIGFNSFISIRQTTSFSMR